MIAENASPAAEIDIGPQNAQSFRNLQYTIEKIGYKTFEKYFNTEIDNSDYQTSFASYFKLIDEIANYSLSQLEDIVNSKEVLDDCKHNQDWFLSQNETHRLVRAFGRILDK